MRIHRLIAALVVLLAVGTAVFALRSRAADGGKKADELKAEQIAAVAAAVERESGKQPRVEQNQPYHLAFGDYLAVVNETNDGWDDGLTRCLREAIRQDKRPGLILVVRGKESKHFLEEATAVARRCGVALATWNPQSGKLERMQTPTLVNINTASTAELQSLPGIGEVTARAIVARRQQARFESVRDLEQIQGIGPKKMANLQYQISVY